MPTNQMDIATGTEPDPRSASRDQELAFDVRDELAGPRLEELHAARGDWAQLARLHASRAEVTVDPGERAQALCRAAAVYRAHLGDVDAALALLRRALSTCPDCASVAAELEAAARASSAAAAEVRAVYTGMAGACEPGAPRLAAELWLRAALIDAAVRRDAAAAVDDLQRVSEAVAAPLIDRIERHAGAAPVLDALADLCRRTGDRARQRRALLRSLEWPVDMSDRAARHHAIATLLVAEGDRDGAAWHLREAVRLDPARGVARSELPAPARVPAATPPPVPVGSPAPGPLPASPSPRPPLPFRVPLPETPEQDRAAVPLAERYWREKRWHELEPLLDRLLRAGAAPAEVGGADALPPVELSYRAGHVALELGNHEKAYRLFRETLAIDQVHLPALGEQALAAAGLGQWDEAHELHGAALLLQRGLGRPPVELADTLFRMGDARENGGHAEAALTLYESALDVHPAHRRALAAACRLHRSARDLRSVDRLLRAALPHARAGQRVAMLIELAGLASRCFGDPGAAVALTRQALALAPGERRLLLPLVEHCEAAGLWRDAIEALTQLAEQETSAVRRGRYLHLAGGLAENVAVGEAVDLLERALDCYFGPVARPPDAIRASCMRAFRDIEALLRPRGEWKRLEQAYRAMIDRLGPGAPELPALWVELGRLDREHLGHPASAIQSFEVASEMEADGLTHHPMLIDLHQSAAPDELDKLIERRRRVLAAEPFSAEHYSALRSLFVKTRNRDGTFCACRALVFLGQADRQEEEFHRRHRSDGVVWPGRELGAADWRRLRHPDEDPLVAAVFALSAERAALTQATSARRLRLRDDRSSALDHVRHLYRNACAALGVGEPDLFVAPGVEADMVLANLRRGSALAPAFVVGCHMYQVRSSAEMVHTMARALSYARPSAYLRLLFGPSNRVAAAFAAACAVGGGPSDGAAADEVAPLADGLRRRAGRAWLSELRGAVGRLRERGGQVDVGRFCRALDATARRAGLLLGGSLDVAASDLRREPTFARRRPREERVADLLVHSVSDEHLALRRALRLALV